MPNHRHSRRRLGALAAALVGATALAACAPTAPSADPSAAAAERTVADARGEQKLPADPKRVVVLEPVQLDTAIALGITPVGAGALALGTAPPAYLGPEAAAIANVGTFAEPNLEQIANLDPDLILGTNLRHEGIAAQLEQIAPTFFLGSQSDPWQDNVAKTAAALNRESGLAELKKQYDDRCARLAGAVRPGTTAQLIRPRDAGLTFYSPTSFAGGVLECSGYTTPQRDWNGDISVEVPAEQLVSAKADVALVTTATPAAADAVPAEVRAMSANFPRIVPVDQAHWITGVGYKGAQTVLDDIERLRQQ